MLQHSLIIINDAAVTDDADLSLLKKLATSAELGNKVSNEQFGQAIGSAYKLLPDPNSVAQRNLSGPEMGERPQYSGKYSYASRFA